MANSYTQSRYLKDPDRKERKPERYSQDSFVKELIGKSIKLSLFNGMEVQGKLMELGMFDVLVQASEQRLIILKSAILTVEVRS